MDLNEATRILYEAGIEPSTTEFITTEGNKAAALERYYNKKKFNTNCSKIGPSNEEQCTNIHRVAMNIPAAIDTYKRFLKSQRRDGGTSKKRSKRGKTRRNLRRRSVRKTRGKR